MTVLQVVSVSSGVSRPSRTTQLASAAADAIAARAPGPVQLHTIEIAELAPQYLGHLERDRLPHAAQFAIERVEAADILIAATPVFRGAYTGLFKHFFDFVDQHALVDVPVVLAATGGSYRHALVIDHGLRPLFSFFRALSVPTPLYATAADFEGDQLADSELQARVELAAEQALRLALPRLAALQRLQHPLSQHQARQQAPLSVDTNSRRELSLLIAD